MATLAATSSAGPLSASHGLAGVIVILIQPHTERDQRRYDELQTLRRQHDQAFDRWLPHITLVPPFVVSSDHHDAAEKLSRLAQKAREVCARHQPHQLLLDQVSTFPLRAYTNVHIRPYPTHFEDKRTRSATAPSGENSSQRIVELQRDLSEALAPLLKGTTKGRKETFKPHVSVGQSTSPKATWQLCTSAERVLKLEGGQGLLCNVDRVQLMTKPKGQEGPYQLHSELPLLSASRS